MQNSHAQLAQPERRCLFNFKKTCSPRGYMYFGSEQMPKARFSVQPIFPIAFKNSPSKEEACYLLLGQVEVDYHFPAITISKMEKMPFIPDTCYSATNEKRFQTQGQIREDGKIYLNGLFAVFSTIPSSLNSLICKLSVLLKVAQLFSKKSKIPTIAMYLIVLA